MSERLDDAHLEAILAHELWHVRRRDNLVATMHMVVEAIFWFLLGSWDIPLETCPELATPAIPGRPSQFRSYPDAAFRR
ncbi:MAG: hypothetical protein DMG50_28965 [Acidobacteria bacterium]|nr:MAG: hypothetical protein DMG50_28965 [Acidobacteriota bacterium]